MLALEQLFYLESLLVALLLLVLVVLLLKVFFPATQYTVYTDAHTGREKPGLPSSKEIPGDSGGDD